MVVSLSWVFEDSGLDIWSESKGEVDWVDLGTSGYSKKREECRTIS
jgi:hypothetical protein